MKYNNFSYLWKVIVLLFSAILAGCNTIGVIAEDKTLEVFGRVIDQHGDPLSNTQIHYTLIKNSLLMPRVEWDRVPLNVKEQHGTLFTDEDGYFHFKKYGRGAFIYYGGYLSREIQNYYIIRHKINVGDARSIYGHPDSSEDSKEDAYEVKLQKGRYYQLYKKTSRASPVILRAWKMEDGQAPLKSERKDLESYIKLLWNENVISHPFNWIWQDVDIDIQLVLGMRGNPEKWLIKTKSGGLLENPDARMDAPKEGYLKQLDLKFEESESTCVNCFLIRRFFYQNTDSGQYRSLSISLSASRRKDKSLRLTNFDIVDSQNKNGKPRIVFKFKEDFIRNTLQGDSRDQKIFDFEFVNGKVRLKYVVDYSYGQPALIISAVDGGIIETQELYPFLAPETGYQKRIVVYPLGMRPSENPSSKGLQREFYYRNEDGNAYSYIAVEIPLSNKLEELNILALSNAQGSRFLQAQPISKLMRELRSKRSGKGSGLR